MTSHTAKARKISKNIAASKKKGAETRAANVRAAGEQKRKALESGGRFREGDTITTVVKGERGGTPNEEGGRDFHIPLAETLSFREESSASRVVSRKISDSVSTKERQDSDFTQRSESDFTQFDEAGEVSAPPITRKQDERFDNLLGKNISFERLSKDPDIKQGFDTLVNIGRDVLHDPILLGGAATKPAIDLSKSIKAGRQETSIDLLSEGKLKEAFEKEGVRGSLTATAGFLLSPLGVGKAAKEAPIALKLLERQKTISKLEKELILPSQSQKLPSGGKLTGIGEESVITGGGLEGGKQVPIFVTKFGRGKSSTFEITPKPQGAPIITVKEAKITGKLDPLSVKRLGAIKEGSFQVDPKTKITGEDIRATKFTAKLGTDRSNIQFQKGLKEDQLREFAVIKETKTENILKGRSEEILKDIRKPPSVFVQSKAEKLAPSSSGFRNIGTPSTQFSTGQIPLGKGGAGQIGKAKVFSAEETQLIKKEFTPTKQTPKQEQEILFSAPRFADAPQKTAEGFEQVSISPAIAKPDTGLKTKIITGTQQDQIKIDKIIPSDQKTTITPTLKITDELTTTLITPRITTTPDEGFKLKDDLILKVTPGDPPPPPPPPIPTFSTPAVPPEEPPIKIRIAVLPPPPLFSGDFDTPSKALGKTKGFRGNVPVDALIGIVRKAPTIEVTEKPGFKIRQFKQRKENNILGGKIKIGIGSTKKQKGKSRKTKRRKESSLSIFGSKPIKLRL